MLTPLLSLALLLPGQAQAPTDHGAPNSPGDGPSDSGWTTVGGIAIQAGDRIVTLGELDTLVRREAERRELPPSDPRYAALAWSAVQQLTQNELIPEAGQDLGLDPEQIQRIARSQIDEDRRKLGTVELADRLAEEGQSFESMAKTKETDLYRQVWNSIVIDGERILGKRPRRDTFIRPGELHAIYRTNKDLLDPDVVQLQVLIAPVAAYGDEESGREFLEDVRQQALEGEDFSALVDEYSSMGRDTQGFQPLTPIPQIAFPGLREFARGAREGDISEIFSLTLGDGKPYLLLARLERKEPGHPPSFDQRDVQQGLRRTFLAERKNHIRRTEQGRLVQSGFTWVNPELLRLRDALGQASPRP